MSDGCFHQDLRNTDYCKRSKYEGYEWEAYVGGATQVPSFHQFHHARSYLQGLFSSFLLCFLIKDSFHSIKQASRVFCLTPWFQLSSKCTSSTLLWYCWQQLLLSKFMITFIQEMQLPRMMRQVSAVERRWEGLQSSLLEIGLWRYRFIAATYGRCWTCSITII